MPSIRSEQAKALGQALFEGVGASAKNAQVVSDHLVESSLRGLDSHGVIRLAQYTDSAQSGEIVAKAEPTVVQDTPTSAIVDAQGGFGQVCAAHQVEVASQKALTSGMACVVSRRAAHIGRLGAFVEALAERGLVAIGTCCSRQAGHFVAPWGGSAGRLATNPIAWAAPTSGRPVVLDMSTSMIAEGKVRALLEAGLTLPEGCVLDAAGNPTTDPADFYGPPRGTILPFGGSMGYKGFGLSMLTMVLGEVMAGYDTGDPDADYMNGLTLIAIDPATFGERDAFIRRMDGMARYLKDTPPAPGSDGVLLPGEMEQRIRAERIKTGIPIPDDTWQQITERADRLGVELPAVEVTA